MSVQLGPLRYNIRRRLGDTDPADYAIPTRSLDRIIISKLKDVAEEAGIAYSWGTTVSVTADSLDDIEISTNAEHWNVLQARDQATGYMLQKRSLQEINAIRDGLTSTTLAPTDPRFFAIYEEVGNSIEPLQKTYLRLDCVPRQNTTLELLRQVLPSPTTGTWVFTDATLLTISEPLATVLEKAAASESAKWMGEEKRQRIGLGSEVITQWDKDVLRGILLEQSRQNGMKRGPYGVRFTAWL